jgi:protein phosphatase
LVVQEVLGGLSAELSKAGGAATAVPLGQTIGRLIAVANDVVLHQSQTDRSCQGMGSTAAVVAVRDGEAAIGHVGDCRVYHYTGGQLKQITQDQTLVARLVELGMLTPDEALTHPQRNEVTQAIGKHTEIQPTSQQIKLAIGDWLIVACDGLHAHVDLPALVAALASAPPSAVALAEHLVDMTNQGGGTDNCTVVALRCW